MRNAFLCAAAVLLLALACSNDNQAPSLVVVYPFDNDTLAKGVITIKALATDNIKVDRVDLFDNDSLLGWGVAGVADTYTYDWNATNVSNMSTHVLKIQVRDRAGNLTAKTIQVVFLGAGPTYHTGQITTSQTWYVSGSPHIVQGIVEIGGSADPVLTIEPGCRVLFESNTGMTCGNIGWGAIVAQGTPAQPITFSSHVAPSAPGDWQSIQLSQMTRGTTTFNRCSLQYGGKGNTGILYLEQTNATIRNCVIRHGAAYGVQCGNNAGFAQFDSNQISSCGKSPLRLRADGVRTIGPGNTFAGNIADVIEVDGGTVSTTGTWVNPGVAYFISSTVAIGDASAPVLTIASGTTVECASGVELYAGLGAPGGLVADGVVFTSARTSPGPGDWQGISFYNEAIDASCQLTRCRIEYAGSNNTGNIFIQNALPEIRGDSIEYSQLYGIYLDGTVWPARETLLLNNWFYGNVAPIGP